MSIDKRELSITGNFLPSFRENADILSVTSDGIKTPHICLMNKLGYVPAVSTLSGAFRCLVAIVHIVIHLALAIFNAQERSGHLAEVRLGFAHLGRGMVEMFPLVGNAATGFFDYKRYKRLDRLYTKMKIADAWSPEDGVSKGDDDSSLSAQSIKRYMSLDRKSK